MKKLKVLLPDFHR